MSKHKPYKNNNKFLITERSLNYILRPVQVRKENYPYTYCIKNMDETVSVTVDRAWTPNNHFILDFIGHDLHAKAYKHVVKKRDSWKNGTAQGDRSDRHDAPTHIRGPDHLCSRESFLSIGTRCPRVRRSGRNLLLHNVPAGTWSRR